jgi:hypothetical protein
VAFRPILVRLVATVVLGLLLNGCADHEPADHGPDVPDSAAQALGCAGPPYLKGHGSYDTGPEGVRGDALEALDQWLDEEGSGTPHVPYTETARHGGGVLLTWTVGSTVLAAYVLRDGTQDTDGNRGWGVSSYAVCDPATWPPRLSDAAGIEVWTDARGHRVPTTVIQSVPGPEHCGWQRTTFLFLGADGADGEFYRDPDGDLRQYLSGSYQADASVPADARDTGYRRDGRELWLAGDKKAAYLVAAEGDAERWPGPVGRPIRCA